MTPRRRSGERTAITAEDAYTISLRGVPSRLFVDGREQRWDVERWLGDPDGFDEVMLAACEGATLDLGCGPGRMTRGLLDRGNPALGVDAVVEAVRMARRRGATALVRDLFAELPGEGRWDTVLLADGNIGIGGDPSRLLDRVSRLLAPGGRLVVEVVKPGTSIVRHRVQLEGRRPAFRVVPVGLGAGRPARNVGRGIGTAAAAAAQRRRSMGGDAAEERLMNPPIRVPRPEDFSHRLRVPRPENFSHRLRGPGLTARVGLWLGVCFLLAFVTGVYSHLAQDAPGWFPAITRPVWLYRVTQGVHVASGAAAVPLLLVKLWSVYPRLFERPPVSDWARLAKHGAERVSIAVLVAGSIFQLATGLANSAQWYPWGFSFRATHYAVGWITIGALLVHARGGEAAVDRVRAPFAAGRCRRRPEHRRRRREPRRCRPEPRRRRPRTPAPPPRTPASSPRPPSPSPDPPGTVV